MTCRYGNAITYDAIGNPTTYYNGASFTWQNGRRLTAIQNGNNTYTYTYDEASGMRLSKTVDGVLYTYYYAGDKLTRMTVGDTVVMDFIYGPSGEPYAVKYNGSVYYYVLNLQGDVVKIFSSVGTPHGTYKYDAWGNILYQTDNDLMNYNPLRSRGYVYDNETGFYYVSSRYYDPEIGRWINADDTAYLGADGTPLSYNLFTYCKNNPVMLSDHNGHAPEWWQWAISGTMVVAGVALVATGVGGVAGGALICAGANSMIGSYVSEATGCSSVAGWVGGMITGAACGTGAGLAGNLLVQATNATGAACLGNLAAGGAVAFGSGTVGSAIGQSVSAAIDGKKLNSKEVVYASTATGAINCLSGLGAGIGTALQGMPAISTTTTTLANSLNTAWSLVSESVCDFLGTISSLLPW